jgi:hypothetical protein
MPIYMFIHIFIHTCLRINTYKYFYIEGYANVVLEECFHLLNHILMYTQICLYIHICTYTRIYTNISTY